MPYLTVGFKPILGNKNPKSARDNSGLFENDQAAHGRYIHNRTVELLTGDLKGKLCWQQRCELLHAARAGAIMVSWHNSQ